MLGLSSCVSSTQHCNVCCHVLLVLYVLGDLDEHESFLDTPTTMGVNGLDRILLFSYQVPYLFWLIRIQVGNGGMRI
jgi:hypothetical protein